MSALREPHPNFFGLHALTYDFDPNAPEPIEWLRFLGAAPVTASSRVQHQLWPWDPAQGRSEDPESVATLQEFLGYLLVCDTSHQKILGLIGPTRSGKGVIARVIRALVGTPNVANPTLSSLGSQFGMQPLVGKLVAIVTDARLSGHTDPAQVVENLLSISGEDARTVDRKHLTSLTLRLYTRFVLISNEVPRLRRCERGPGQPDDLLAAGPQFPRLRRLWADQPPPHGTARHPQLGDRGLATAQDRGSFLQPKSGDADVELMHDSSSPVGAFLRESCILGPEHTIAITDLYGAGRLGASPRDARNTPATSTPSDATSTPRARP